MLPDLIRIRNTTTDVPLKKVTNVKIISQMLSEVHMGQELFSQIAWLLKVFFTIPLTTYVYRFFCTQKTEDRYVPTG